MIYIFVGISSNKTLLLIVGVDICALTEDRSSAYVVPSEGISWPNEVSVYLINNSSASESVKFKVMVNYCMNFGEFRSTKALKYKLTKQDEVIGYIYRSH